jgi:hypothetical protein
MSGHGVLTPKPNIECVALDNSRGWLRLGGGGPEDMRGDVA